ncbi:MAG: ABC transporter substrate-binding protein [Solirubrobacterales bacterium]
MRSKLTQAVAVGVVLVLGAALSSCGSGGGGDASAAKDKYPAPTSAPSDAQKGGTLTVLASGDVDHIDPGAAYYQFTYMITNATQRTLLSWQPNDVAQPTPDFASGPPQISSDKRTLTFHLKSGIRFSPPVNRAATSADVKYAIERGLMPGVANGYESAYLGTLQGFKQAEAAVKADPTKAPDISGIQTPDQHTIVFKLTQPQAAVVEQALSLPLSAPVPPEYAAKYDASNPSTYGEHLVATGPYMVSSYSPDQEIKLVRNPNWDPKSDWRPAYLDSVDIREGYNDTFSASKKILTGSDQVNGDFYPASEALKDAATQYPSQLAVSSSGGTTYAPINTSTPPFDNPNVRKALVAVADRQALATALGGPLAGDLATHFIPPQIPGFDQAGGAAGPKGSQFDFLQSPNGNPQLAAQYMKKAGYPSGKCTGSGCQITMIASSEPTQKDAASIVRDELSQLGFKVSQQYLNYDVMVTKFCAVPKNEPNICPNFGWNKDFNDAQSILDVPFNGENIVPENNANWPLLNDKSINKAMDKAKLINDPAQRAEAWGKIDDQITVQAPAIPIQWANDDNIRSADVAGVVNLFSSGWDISFTSLSK